MKRIEDPLLISPSPERLPETEVWDVYAAPPSAPDGSYSAKPLHNERRQKNGPLLFARQKGRR